jgi:SAM-dependent methyltransferase
LLHAIIELVESETDAMALADGRSESCARRRWRFPLPEPLKRAARSAYHGLFRLQLRLRCWHADRTAAPDESGLPLPPALLRYRVSELLGRDDFLIIGRGCAEMMEQYTRTMGVDLAHARRVLDFGCGCGRTLRWFLREFPGVEFHGADVDEEAIAWCRRNLPGGHFTRNQPQPPLPYQDGYFDVIYCLSVFTHLDEAMQDAWLAELRRLLTPGGVVLLTVHSDLAARVLDDEGLAVLRTAGFVYRRSERLRGIVPDWYHTSFHSRDYIVQRLAQHFEDIRYETVPDGPQAIVMARAPGA